MPHSVYLFDLDGTLINSMPYWAESMIQSLTSTSTSFPENIIEIITPLGYAGTAEYYINVLGVKSTKEQLMKEFYDWAYPKYRDEIPFKAGVYDYLTMLKQEGYSLNVLTASPHEMLDTALKRLGVFDWFDHVWSCDDFGTTKADPQIYLRAAQKLGVAPHEIAFFDDNIHSIETAKRAGLYTVGVYDLSGESFKSAMQQTANAYLDTFEGASEV